MAVELESVRYGEIRDFSAIGVESASEHRIIAHGIFDSVIGYGESVKERRVGECVGGCPWYGAGHVGDAVVDDAVFDVGGIGVRGCMGGLATAALIDGDVDDGRALFHAPDQFSRDELGGACASSQDGADE